MKSGGTKRNNCIFGLEDLFDKIYILVTPLEHVGLIIICDQTLVICTYY